jgi:hypothetical protein
MDEVVRSAAHTLQIPRKIISNAQNQVELHGFCDSSMAAYGACIYIRTCDETNNTYNTESFFLWTDSSIVLSWLNSSPNTWKIFVANRVAEIQRLTEVDNWHHIGSKNNPADLVSRGVPPENLIDNHFWFHGFHPFCQITKPSGQTHYLIKRKQMIQRNVPTTKV